MSSAFTGSWDLPWDLDPIRAVARWPGSCIRAAAGGPGSWDPKDPVPGANQPNLQHTQQPKVQAWQPPSKKLIFKPFFFYWCCPMPPLWHQCSNIGWPWPPPGQDPRGSHWIRALWARIQGGDPRGMCTGSKLSTWQGCRPQQPPQNCSGSAKAECGGQILAHTQF